LRFKKAIRMLYKALMFDMGATGVEYALIIMLVAAVIVSIIAILGGQVFEFFEKVPPF